MGNFFKDRIDSDEFREEYFVAEAQARLDSLLDEKGVTRAELARKLDVSRARVSQIFSDDANNLTLRLLARSFLALGEQPMILTKSEFEKLQKRSEMTAAVTRAQSSRATPNQEVLTASLIAELLRSVPLTHSGDREKTGRRNGNVRNWAEHGSNVFPLRRAVNG
ncbi:helix-turn-helix domain-containing protein [Novosphingobium kaempferiae]|uniref:helix-turn-helix domain-containing protein n=1 Tax=Novosphingobium kaempferiae TaxID=2896849 RepID=UPI001E3BEA7F|nr:XRE family transcriptional regulator [Novosphingobium kaempferiae]